MLIAVGNLLGTEGFRLLVGNTLGMAQVGMLSALLAFRTMASTLIENMSNVLTPGGQHARGARWVRCGWETLLISSTKYASVAAALVCVVPLAVAESFLGLWLGEDALPFAPVMFAILVGQIPVIISAGAQQVLVGLGEARLAGSTVIARGIASLLAALLYLALAPQPTLLGATLSLYAVQAAGGIAMLVFGARATGAGVLVMFRDALLWPLALALVGAGVTALAGHWIGSEPWSRWSRAWRWARPRSCCLVAWLGIDAEERPSAPTSRCAPGTGRAEAHSPRPLTALLDQRHVRGVDLQVAVHVADREQPAGAPSTASPCRAGRWSLSGLPAAMRRTASRS